MKDKMKIEDLKNTKIYLKTEDESVQFQEKVFKLGVKWLNSKPGTMIHSTYPFFYIDNLILSCVSKDNYKYFIESKRKQIFLEDVLAIEEPVSLVTGMPVLVRDHDTLYWEYDIFGRICSDECACKYRCVSDTFYQCIPYEGNEHLLGTSGSFSY